MGWNRCRPRSVEPQQTRSSMAIVSTVLAGMLVPDFHCIVAVHQSNKRPHLTKPRFWSWNADLSEIGSVLAIALSSYKTLWSFLWVNFCVVLFPSVPSHPLFFFFFHSEVLPPCFAGRRATEPSWFPSRLQLLEAAPVSAATCPGASLAWQRRRTCTTVRRDCCTGSSLNLCPLNRY